MVKREYGKHVANYKWSTTPGIVNRELEVYQTKTGWKGLLWNSGRRGWRERQYAPVKTVAGKSWQDVMDQAGVPDGAEMECPVLHDYGTLKKI